MWQELLNYWRQPSLIETLMLICIVSTIGLYLAKLKISKFTLGSAYVFFVGILFAHWGVKFNEEMLQFCQNFGLIIFVYALGLQVGPGFVASFRKQGIRLNLWGLGVILLGTALVLALYAWVYPNITNMMGVLCGAVTNTPALAAAQQAVAMAHQGTNASSILNNMALATAITYPLGVLGGVIVLQLLRPIAKKTHTTPPPDDMPPYVTELAVTNPAINGCTLSSLQQTIGAPFIVSRLWRNGKVLVPASDLKVQLQDHIIIVCQEEHAKTIQTMIGQVANVETGVDWEEDDPNHLVSRRILISKPGFNGVKLGTLRLRNHYGVNVTRVSRAEMDLLPTPSLRLQLGDRLTVVGKENAIAQLSERLGNQLNRLDTPYLVSIFLGIFLGCALGSLPITFPGLSQPIRLGIAGGPIIVGILMGAYGSRLRLTTYITQSANLMLRTFGLVIYLACLGLMSGAGFFQTLTHGPGLLWLLLGATITLLPCLLVGTTAILWGRMSYSVIGGVICGAMANPMALEYLMDNGGDSRASVSYATVYPLGMFLRVILAQVIIVLFFH